MTKSYSTRINSSFRLRITSYKRSKCFWLPITINIERIFLSLPITIIGKRIPFWLPITEFFFSFFFLVTDNHYSRQIFLSLPINIIDERIFWVIDHHYGRENFFLVADNHHIVHETILLLVDSSYLWYNFSLDISIDNHRRWEHFYRLPITVILDEIFVFK